MGGVAAATAVVGDVVNNKTYLLYYKLILMKKNLILLCLLFFGSATAYAQVPEDVLRLSSPGLVIGARTLGMGMTSIGIDRKSVV